MNHEQGGESFELLVRGGWSLHAAACAVKELQMAAGALGRNDDNTNVRPFIISLLDEGLPTY